jgi:hypothetical protein
VLTQRPSRVFTYKIIRGVSEGMTPEEFLAWLDSLDSSEELDEQV